ncbi:alanine racemase [Saccharothrix algeriensis]|uniref:Alanine racemase n=1 Tax=Saccharothrix algeriensis TaxID=173560 RepID=A0A8T8I6J0_9PSEU|nr:alanine racemase [Saccharothrix algeriensis]
MVGAEGARSLAERYGTPLYLYELDEVDAAVAELRRALPDPAVLYYSLKANPHPLLARVLRDAGCQAEISSTGELAAAREAGFAGADCLYTGPAKTEQEVAAALAAGVRRFSVESETDYHRVAALAARAGVRADCLVRVNTMRANGASSLRMSGAATQFGVDVADLAERPAAFAARPGARVVGLHFFAVSNASGEEVVAEEVSAGIAAAARLRDEAGIDLRVLDLGGGFAAPYAREGDRPGYGGLRAAVERGLDEHLPGWRAGEPAVAFESGRFLVGSCGRLLVRVADVKRGRGRTFVVLDGGINHLGGLSGLGRLLPVAARVLPTGEAGAGAAVEERATVVGPLCTPADVLARDAALSSPTGGDLLVIPNVGAYGLTASLIGFLSRPVAAEVVLRGGHPVDASRVELRRVPIRARAAEADVRPPELSGSV